MSTNLSKQKREDFLQKITQIKSFVENHSTDDETRKLLRYIGELEKDLYGKKFGLVFEEHKETIDDILEKNTPVLKEDTELLIKNQGNMNFLLEGDNLAALELLTKTHREKIDLIYIDPPYNTGNKDFVYDDTFVDLEDGFRHSKWLSFMERRLKLASKLLTAKGILAISIGYQEVHNLVLLCEELFLNRQVVCITVQTSGGKPSGGFDYLHEYVVFVTPHDFKPNRMTFVGGVTRSPFEGLTLSTFDKTQRPNQTYPIFIDKKTHHIVGTGPSLADRVKDGTYTGELSDFVFDYDEAPEGTVAVFPVSSRRADCVWRLIATRLMSDWEKGYIKVSENRVKNHPNKFSIQYLPSGVIKKVEDGTLEVKGSEKDAPTLVFGENTTVGSEIPTIWTEKAFYTTKGTSALKKIFDTKKFPYPKPIDLISEIIRATTDSDSIVLDFFAGSGTTGHAVMKLNQEEGENRKFILCTNNQNKICRDVTYERIKRVIELDNYEESLKYFKVDFIPIENRFYYEYADDLLCHVRELVELENAIDFSETEEITIVLTDEELEEFVQNTKDNPVCKTVYLGHDVLLSGEQQELFKKHSIQVNVIPDYYYNELRG
ncbi:adenine-specific DNA-methyltransferase [Bacillus thermophilus]|uniref:Adenine-specific DNA-methyltransferase n=1 Tax=Siminovitchia thermophila TaxID=1245522 RepID=A0ABS2R6R4_9BACI|nr:site-specific DNA-methyltransferase [Siminovitchia thermophila]MBM7715346.1 adenine-specific DNA-methyltransferase [Siminovitchia thermophila]